MTNCGASSESCCTSLEVAGGTFYRTYTNSGSGPTAEADPASVSGFRLDKYLVTVGRFRRFVNAWNGGAGYAPPAGAGKHSHLNGGQGLANVGVDAGVEYETGWIAADDRNIVPTNANVACLYNATWTNSAGTQENLPINCIVWYEAYAFCIWDGGFLPSEAEWEYAAAGGGGAGGQREYPWGSTAPGTGSQYAIYGLYFNGGQIAPVGTATLGAGLWGQLDMAGEVFEWNVDWLFTYVSPCTDCAYLTTAPGSYPRVMRGGNFDIATSEMLPPSRNGASPTLRDDIIGFRCARTP
jgi:sulfatase modifying factor 1